MSTDSNKTVLEYAIGFKTVLELYHIHTEDLTGSIISSVVPPVTNTVRKALHKITHHQAMVDVYKRQLEYKAGNDDMRSSGF